MNFEQLKIFITVVEQRSFTKAAEALYISHSTTSRNVSSLEESLGVRLLVRDNRSVRLTPAGDILYREGAKLLKKIDAIEGAVRNAGMGLSGKLSIASVNLYSYELWGGYKVFCKKYPEVVLGMYYRDLKDVWEQVSSGEADIGVTFSYAVPAERDECELLRVSRERFCAVVPLDNPLAERTELRLEDLDNADYISLQGMDFGFIRDPEQREFLTKVASRHVPMPTLESLLLRLRSGNGVSVLPAPIAYERGVNCAVLELEDVDTGFDVLMTWRIDNLNPSLPMFLDTIKGRLLDDSDERNAKKI